MNVGDTVYLKSGSMAMTVVKLYPDEKEVDLQWQNGSTLTTTRSPEAALTDADPRPAIQKAERELKEAVDPAVKPA